MPERMRADSFGAQSGQVFRRADDVAFDQRVDAITSDRFIAPIEEDALR